MASSAQPKFRIDATTNDLLTNSTQRPPETPEPKAASLPEPVSRSTRNCSLIPVLNRLPSSATGVGGTLCARCAAG